MAWSEMVRVIRVKLPGKQKNGFRFSVKRGRHRLWIACTSLAAKVKAQAAAKPAARSLPRGCSAATFQSTVLSAVGKRRAQKRLDKTTQQRRGWLKWEHASYERCRRFPILAEWRPRIIVCAVRMHRGIDCNIQNGMADVALGHLSARGAGDEGDWLVGISAIPRKYAPSTPFDDKQVWPPTYWSTLRAFDGDRAVVWMVVAERLLSMADYSKEYGVYGSQKRRRTAIFKKSSGGRLVVRERARVPPGGLNDGDFVGRVVLGRRFLRFPTNLDGAPRLPNSFHDWLQERRFGIGHRTAEPGSRGYAPLRAFLRDTWSM